MTSKDNALELNEVVLQLRELVTVNREQIAEMKAVTAQMQKDNAEFRAMMVKEFNTFKDEVRQDMKTFKAEVREDMKTFKTEVNTRFDNLEATVSVIEKDIIGLKHYVAGLYHWDYWLLSIVLVVFAMPQIVAGLKSLFSVITEGIAGIIALFRR